VVPSPRSCEEVRLKAAPIVVCARTSLAVTTRAKRHAARCGLTPRRVLTSSMARGTRAARDLRAARTACRRRSRGGAQGDGGRCLRFLQASPPKMPTLRAAGRRDGPRRVDGNARLRNRSRAMTPRSRHPEVAPDVPIQHRAQDRYAASDASRVHDRGSETPSLGLSRRTRRSRQARSTGPPLAGCLPTGRLEDGQLRLHRLKDGETSLGPS